MKKSTSHSHIFVKHLQAKPGQFQFFQHEFVEALMRAGIEGVEEKDCRGWIRKEWYLLKGLLHQAASLFGAKKKGIVIVPCRGDDMHYKSLPYYPSYEIVPMLWDAWPAFWPKTFKALKMLNVKLCLCSSRQVAAAIREKLGIQTVWIPEGIDIKKYNHSIKPLHERSVDVYEMGRIYDKYHAVIERLIEKGAIKSYLGKKTDDARSMARLTFPTAESLIEGMRDIKCITCFPKSMTHPSEAGFIETMTIRYWECMLSGCLITGHAPKELLDVVGYNPVIEADWENAEQQLADILTNIKQYDELIRKNHQTALKHAAWDSRVPQILSAIAGRQTPI